MKRFAAVLAALAMAASAAPGSSAPDPARQTQDLSSGKPLLEIVFVLDTTGSMGGLIEGARQRIWGIINDVQKGRQGATVKVGLVAYRDRGDVYVTKVLPLTTDLDKVFATLMDYKADGGGDRPEDVRQALYDGVHKSGWSQPGQNTAQIMFLVGDSPPHDDYTNEPDTVKTADEAAKTGIIINTIECGAAPDTKASWQAISTRTAGDYFMIAQDGGVKEIPTPFDKPLAALGTKLGTTYMAYGGGGGVAGEDFRGHAAELHFMTESSVVTAAPAPVAADRAYNKALNGFAYKDDLYQSLENGTVTLKTLKPADLPDDLRKLAPAAREKLIKSKLAERKQIRETIVALAKQRDAYLVKQRELQAANHKDASFDLAVLASLKKQVARRHIRI